MNARSINNKLPELYNLLYGINYGVVIVTESWLRSSTPDGLLDPHNKFTIIRCDRQQEFPGGGVCVFISKMYSVAIVNVSELYPELEISCVDLLHGGVRCRLFAIYRAPSSNNMSKLLECLSTYSDVKFNCIIAGDFNCPNIDWDSLKTKADGTQDELLNFAVTRGFSQVVQSATRADNLLDIILTNEPLSICNINVIQPFGTSDHSQVIFSLFNDCIDEAMTQLLSVMTGLMPTTMGCLITYQA